VSDDVLGKLERLEDRLDEVRDIVKSMQLADAEGRGDLKVIAGKLDNAATALANAALSIQKGQLNAEPAEDGKLPKWARVAGLVMLAIITALVGVKEVLPVIVKLLTGV